MEMEINIISLGISTCFVLYEICVVVCIEERVFVKPSSEIWIVCGRVKLTLVVFKSIPTKTMTLTLRFRPLVHDAMLFIFKKSYIKYRYHVRYKLLIHPHQKISSNHPIIPVRLIIVVAQGGFAFLEILIHKYTV